MESIGCKIELNPHGRKLSKDEVAILASEHDAIIAGTENLSLLVSQTESLKIIARVGVGLDGVPLEQCKEKNIKVTYTPEPVISAVSELTLGFILNALRKITSINTSIKQSGWQRQLGREVSECVFGIIGFGKIGFKVAQLLTAFKPAGILINDVCDVTEKISMLGHNGQNIKQSSFEYLIQSSDIVTIHLPLSDKTRNVISKNELRQFKNHSYLINTARGGIVDESALYDAVNSGKLDGAALDVFEQEPYSGILLQQENIIVTSHIASYTSKCREKMEIQALTDIYNFCTKEPLINEVIIN